MSQNICQTAPYQRCLVMAGGGFRFGYYLGMYAACEQKNKKPDILLATCGAAIAAAIIHCLPDDQTRRTWLLSPEMHAFWLKLGPNPAKSLSSALSGVVSRALFANDARRIPDLLNDYLFEIPEPLLLPTGGSYAGAPDVAIIAGRFLYDPREAGKIRGKRKLFAETVFSGERTASLLRNIESPASRYPWSTVSHALLVDTGVALSDAVRASIADMYYFRSHQIGEHHYLGGVVDLFPIEIARRLASEVLMEKKGRYSRLLDLPAVRMVLGFDGNQRLHEVGQQYADYWIDTSDMLTALADFQIENRIEWRKNRLSLQVPASYEDYVKMIESQWQYGYQKALAALS